MIHCWIPAYVYWTFLPQRLQKETSFLSVVLCLMKGLGFLEVLCKYLTRNIWFVCCSLKWTSSSEVGPFILARICSLIFVSSHKAKYLYSIPSKYQIFSSRDLRISFFIFHYCECLFIWLWTSRESWSVFLQFWKIFVCFVGHLECISRYIKKYRSRFLQLLWYWKGCMPLWSPTNLK
jgi:hypothetical protein